MKHAKKPLALLLALVLGLSLGAPALAANWDDFYIVTQPQDLVIPFGGDISLSVRVNAPAGVEVSYQWYSNANGNTYWVEEAKGPDLRCSLGNSRYFLLPDLSKASYCCAITGVERDTDGNAIETKTLISNNAYVALEGSDSVLYGIFQSLISALGGAVGIPALAAMFTGGIGGLLFPILYPIGVIVFFITNLIDFFA